MRYCIATTKDIPVYKDKRVVKTQTYNVRVTFSAHAADRMLQRFGIPIKTNHSEVLTVSHLRCAGDAVEYLVEGSDCILVLGYGNVVVTVKKLDSKFLK